jgi:paraquat-inducible protein A
VLSGRAAGRVDLPLALASCALLLLIPATWYPLMSVSTLGAVREGWLYSGIPGFTHQGYWELATLVLTCALALPYIYMGALVWVLGSLHFRREWAQQNGTLGSLYRWVLMLRPWMMIEVFLIGGFVAYTRIDAVASVEVDLGGWCLIASTFALLFALTQVDDRTVWGALHPHGVEPPLRENPEDHALTSILVRGGPLACTICDLIVPASAEGKKCPRCSARLHRRKPDAFRRTLALLLAGYLLYIPANLLPVLTLTQVGSVEHNTIMSGVFELIHNDLWPLAVIVFVASIVLPLMKLLGLTWMLLAIQLRSGFLLHGRTRFYRMIDLIGRWSNIDVFMGSVLVAVLQFGALTSIHAGPGLVAFAAVVVITMFATESFDARLMWDAARGRP